MVAWPTTGSSEGTWNDEQETFVRVEHNANGTHNVHDTEGGYAQVDVDSTKTNVYTKYFTGTLDADTSTSFVHSVVAANILSISCITFNSSDSTYKIADFRLPASANDAFACSYDATNIIISVVGSNVQGQVFRVKIEYTI